MWKYRACALEISLFLNVTRATFECQSNEGVLVRATRDVAHDEVSALRRLVRTADLYGPGHVGEDFSPTDAAFETLRFRPVDGGRAVVLVTSGNRTFVEPGPRRDLLELLNRIGLRYVEQARPRW